MSTEADLTLPGRVVVTGGLGFVGSHLCRSLLGDGHEVVAVDDASTGCLDNVADLLSNPLFRLVRASVMDPGVMDEAMAGAAVVFHLAAAVGVRLIVDDPLRTIETNIAGTKAVLDAALGRPVRVVVASTSEVYGKSDRFPWAEDDDIVLGPTSVRRWNYAASKMIDEFVALGYHRQHDLDTVVVRLFNVVGPRQTGQYGMVVPRFVRAALDGEPLPVHGDGTQRRCFLHVHDAVDAFRRLGACDGAVGEVVNIGATEEVSILELAGRILDAVGRPEGRSADGAEGRTVFVPYEVAFDASFEDIPRRVPSIEKIHRLTGWAPVRTLEQIIDDVIADQRSQTELRLARAAG